MFVEGLLEIPVSNLLCFLGWALQCLRSLGGLQRDDARLDLVLLERRSPLDARLRCGSGTGEITSAALFGSHQGGQVVDAQDASGNCAPSDFTGKTDTGCAQLARSVAPWLQERGGDPRSWLRWSSATLPLNGGPSSGPLIPRCPTVRLAAFQQLARRRGNRRLHVCLHKPHGEGAQVNLTARALTA